MIFVNASNVGVENGTLANPYNTIQEGVNAAVNGDTVSVAAGLYEGMRSAKHHPTTRSTREWSTRQIESDRRPLQRADAFTEAEASLAT